MVSSKSAFFENFFEGGTFVVGYLFKYEPIKRAMTTGYIEQRLSQYYQQQSPHTYITNVTRITEGWETDVYSFTAHEKGVQKDLILRVYPGNDAQEKSQREFNTMDQLYKMGYSVPAVFIVETDAAPLGNPFVIMEQIKGTQMWPLLKGFNNKLMTVFCELFVELHTLDWRPFVKDPSQFTGSSTWINQFLERAKMIVHTHGKREFNLVLKWLESKKVNVPCQQLSVTHNDYHPNNILVHNGKAFVIDWSSAAVEDFRMDVAWTLLLVSTFETPAYRDIILSEYERIAGFTIEHIEYFDVLACVKRLFTISVSLTEGAARMGMRPGAESMMKRNVSHIQKVYDLLRERTGIPIPEVEELISTLC